MRRTAGSEGPVPRSRVRAVCGARAGREAPPRSDDERTGEPRSRVRRMRRTGGAARDRRGSMAGGQGSAQREEASMRSIGITVATLALIVVVAGCKNRKQEPIPGPRAARPVAEAPTAPSPHPVRGGGSVPTGAAAPGAIAPNAPGSSGERRHGASGISWFQGGFEEAFSCPKCTAMFWRDALDR